MSVKIIVGDCVESMKAMPDQSVHCCVTSPPYWGLRDYGHDGQIGLEDTPEAYVSKMVDVFREVRRVLRDDGTLWLNLGDSYAGSWGNYGGQNRGKGTQREIISGSSAHQSSYDGLEKWRPPTTNPPGLKQKDLVGIPWRVAFALQADGWYLRQDIIWHKPNPMPESVRDRCTKAHEYVFLLTKSERYFYDAEAVKEASTGRQGQSARFFREGKMGGRYQQNTGGPKDAERVDDGTRNRRSVWTVATQPYSGAHFATFPPDLVEPCIKAGTSEKGCCPTCGKPWERVVEKPEMPKVAASDLDRYGTGDAGVHRKVGQAYQDWRDANPNRTTGWRPACTCGGSPVPCTVLDPFGGAGTTALVADQLHRNAILCELNPEYARLAENRITQDSPMFSDVVRT